MTTDDIFLIRSYSRREAIDDGVLIDMTPTAKDAGFRFPVALTSAAWSTCVAIPSGVADQDEAGRLWDVLTMLRHACRARNADDSVRHFDVLVLNGNTRPKLVRLKAVCGPDDDLSPCLTVMLSNED